MHMGQMALTLVNLNKSEVNSIELSQSHEAFPFSTIQADPPPEARHLSVSGVTTRRGVLPRYSKEYLPESPMA